LKELAESGKYGTKSKYPTVMDINDSTKGINSVFTLNIMNKD